PPCGTTRWRPSIRASSAATSCRRSAPPACRSGPRSGSASGRPERPRGTQTHPSNSVIWGIGRPRPRPENRRTYLRARSVVPAPKDCPTMIPPAAIHRRLVLVLLVLAAMLALPAAAGAMVDTDVNPPAAPAIWSDRADYNPGATVTLSGAGWAPGEAVHIAVNDSDGQTWSYAD